MTDTMPSSSTFDRAAVDRLIDLLDLLPKPRLDSDLNREFWRTFARTELDRDDEHGEHDTPEVYITTHLAPTLDGARKPDAGASTVEGLAMYALMFFDGNRPKMWRLLDDCVAGFPTAEDGAAGRRWADEVCTLAWQLYSSLQVQYRRRLNAEQ